MLESQANFRITGDDCFTIGRYAYNLKDWRHTRGWMLTALEKFDEENGTALLDVPSVYDHLSFSEYSVSENQSVGETKLCSIQCDNHFMVFASNCEIVEIKQV